MPVERVTVVCSIAVATANTLSYFVLFLAVALSSSRKYASLFDQIDDKV